MLECFYNKTTDIIVQVLSITLRGRKDIDIALTNFGKQPQIFQLEPRSSYGQISLPADTKRTNLQINHVSAK